MARPRNIANIYNPPKASTQFSEGQKSKGILDDHAVRKNINSMEGTVEQVPTNDNHIVNKKYTDAAIDTDIATHAALDTGVHGAGADTIAADADIATHAALPNVHHNKLHASTHEVAGDDLVNHDDLTGFVANEHILPLAPIQMVQ